MHRGYSQKANLPFGRPFHLEAVCAMPHGSYLSVSNKKLLTTLFVFAMHCGYIISTIQVHRVFIHATNAIMLTCS